MLNFVPIVGVIQVLFSHSKVAQMKSPFGCDERKLK